MDRPPEVDDSSGSWGQQQEDVDLLREINPKCGAIKMPVGQQRYKQQCAPLVKGINKERKDIYGVQL